MAKIHPGAGPKEPQVVVLFGATGDLARRMLLPSLYGLDADGLLPQLHAELVRSGAMPVPPAMTAAQAAFAEPFAVE